MSLDVSRRAISEWVKGHKLGKAWYIVHGYFRLKDNVPFVILHTSEKLEMPWCCNCNGTGHYFRTKKLMKHWLWDNGWLRSLYVNKHESEEKGGNGENV